MAPPESFDPDPEQLRVLQHDRGPLLVTGAAGSGKTAVLRERFARLIEGGAAPEGVALVVGSKRARAEARAALLRRLDRPLPELRVLTVHALAFHVMGERFATLGYEEPPEVLTAADQFARVRELLAGEDRAQWPAYGGLLGVRGFADQVRQFVSRAQEALLQPADIVQRAERAGLTGWRELAVFYQRYLDVLGSERAVDFAGLVWEAARAAENAEPIFDHVIVDDFQDATFGAELLIGNLGAAGLVVAGDPESHVFSFQGTTDVPLQRFPARFPATPVIDLATDHRSFGVERRALFAAHVSDEHAAVARELLRIHVDEDVPWGRIAVVVRRQGGHLGGLLRALDDARIPRSVPESGLSLASDPATYPYILGLRWLARPDERDALIEPMLTSELVGLSPASARWLVRAAQAAGDTPADALARDDGLTEEEQGGAAALRAVIADAARVADRSVLDAFGILWRRLPYSRRLVRGGERADPHRRDLDAVVALAEVVGRAGGSADPSVQAFVATLEPGADSPGLVADDAGNPDAVQVLTAHATAGREFDTVVVVGTTEGDFPSLARPEPMFDLSALEHTRLRSEHMKARLEDERRLFGMVAARARRRLLFTATDGHGEESTLTVRSRFVDELGLTWTPIPPSPDGRPVSVGEAIGTWRRSLADHGAPTPDRLAALDGLVAIGADPGAWWFQRDWTGSERQLHEHVRVSASRLETLENCDLQFVLREELGLGRPSGYHAYVGKLVHGLIDECDKGEIERDLATLTAEVGARWRPQEFPSMAVSEAHKRLVTEYMLPNWFEHYGGKPPLATEQHFEFEFEGATVVGYIDRIGPILAGGNRITDYKTGKPENAPKPEDSLQLGIYYLAVNEAEELAPYRPVRAVELAFLKGHWRTHELVRPQWMVSSRSDETYQARIRERLSRLIEHLRELYETGRYRPSTQADCWSCEFKTLCPLWPEGRELFPVEAAP